MILTSRQDEDKRRIAEGIETVKQFNQRSKEAHEKQMQGLQGFEQIQRTARALSDELQDDQKPIARDTDGSDTMERQPTMREEVPSDGPQNLKDSESDMATPSLRSQASVKTRHGWPSMTGLKKKIGRRSTQDKEGNA